MRTAINRMLAHNISTRRLRLVGRRYSTFGLLKIRNLRQLLLLSSRTAGHGKPQYETFLALGNTSVHNPIWFNTHYTFHFHHHLHMPWTMMWDTNKGSDQTVILYTIQFIYFFKEIYYTVYIRCTRMNCKIVPVTNSNRYVQYGASGKGVVELQTWITAVKKEQKEHCGFHILILYVLNTLSNTNYKL